ncbi:MAG TPA: hypothetical protein P5137_10865 [Candidatus Brocadiia bacterium]|nr:hypothetical protein [Candidatus Brocadiia bacterium]
MGDKSQGDPLIHIVRKLHECASGLFKAAEVIRDAAEKQRQNNEKLLETRDRINEMVARMRAGMQRRTDPAPAESQPVSQPAPAPMSAARPSGRMTMLEYMEMQSLGEYERLRSLPPISADEAGNVDWDQLSQALLGE